MTKAAICKVYSFDGLSVIDQVSDDYVRSGRNYYKPEIKDNNLVISPYVTNPNINVKDVIEDKYGTIFVRNDTVFDKIGNTVYYKDGKLNTTTRIESLYRLAIIRKRRFMLTPCTII